MNFRPQRLLRVFPGTRSDRKALAASENRVCSSSTSGLTSGSLRCASTDALMRPICSNSFPLIRRLRQKEAIHHSAYSASSAAMSQRRAPADSIGR